MLFLLFIIYNLQENIGHRASPQIEGLNVDLHDYQLQTVQWAVEQEQLEGGIMRRLFAPVQSSAGVDTEYWYSPFVGALVKKKPHDVRGGLICEEVASISLPHCLLPHYYPALTPNCNNIMNI